MSASPLEKEVQLDENAANALLSLSCRHTDFSGSTQPIVLPSVADARRLIMIDNSKRLL